MHEWALKLTRNGYQSFFSESLEKDHSLSLHPLYTLYAEGCSFFKAELKQGIIFHSQSFI